VEARKELNEERSLGRSEEYYENDTKPIDTEEPTV
jgi:hypothetical protein